MLNKSWNFFWRSSTTPTITCGSWLTPPLHNLASSPRRSWFFKNSISQFSTFESNLVILIWFDHHKIFGDSNAWRWKFTVKISWISNQFKGGKLLIFYPWYPRNKYFRAFWRLCKPSNWYFSCYTGSNVVDD